MPPLSRVPVSGRTSSNFVESVTVRLTTPITPSVEELRRRVDYLEIGEVDVTDFRCLDVGRAEVTYFVTWLPDNDKWGVGGLVSPHLDISETYYFFGDCFGMAPQHSMSCLAM
jgi:hypothetical protein